ncbi:Uncharacterized protein TCAP_01599 [Tolypocladium capitatum]|uniref:Uncharacterized protein n=1 Tax=Tolypocladium capitatum TaxID=45235 RepID=A0A2K3QLQ7_9HYPO|nr:Uncharacterized protein TCAP_01599 [Tolypocladium capitatum]
MSSGHDASISTSPQSALQSRRGSKVAPQHAFSFSAPGPSRPRGVTKRPRTMDSFGFPDDEYDDDSPRKGGHSLRKRARVDYTFEHIDDDVLVPNSSASATRKKRTNADDAEDIYAANSSKKRGHSLGAETPSSIRRNPARKAAETRAYQDDEDVKDTIEVGVSFSNMDESGPRPASHSSASSPAPSHEASWKSAPATSHYEGNFPSAACFVAALSNARENVQHSANTKIPAVADADKLAVALWKLPVAEPAVSEPAVSEPAVAQPENAVFASDSVPRSPSEAVHGSNMTNTPSVTKPALNSLNSTQTTLIASAEHSTRETLLDGSRPSLDASKACVSVADDRLVKILGDAKAFISWQPIRRPDSDGEDTAASTIATPVVTAAAQEMEPHAVETSEPASRTVASAEESEDASRQAQTVPQNAENGAQKCAADINPEKQPPSRHPTIPVMPSAEPTPNSTTNNTSAVGAAPPEGAVDANGQPADAAYVYHPGELPQAHLDGRWAHLSPYIYGEYEVYPDRALAFHAEEDGAEEAAEDQDVNDTDPTGEYGEYGDYDDQGDAPEAEEPAPAVGTPALECPVPNAVESTAANSPAAPEGGNGEADGADSQELPERERHFKLPKLRRPEEYIAALENYQQMSEEELLEALNVVSVVMRDWQREYLHHCRIVEEHESGFKPRWGQLNYLETVRMRPWKSHDLPDFVPKGVATVKTNEQKRMTKHNKDKVLEDWIKLISWNYKDPSKEGLSGQVLVDEESTGVMTRGRSLRNQPKQTTKATETDEVATTKRTRRPAQRLDLAAQEASRSATPVAAKGGRRHRHARAGADESGYKAEATPDGEDVVPPKSKRQRRTRAAVANGSNTPEPSTDQPASTPGHGRAKKTVMQTSYRAGYVPEEDAQAESPRPKRKRHLLTLKIPKGAKNFSEPSSAITDNGDSRPTTSSSDSTTRTMESSYSFRPKRQKRFRDEPEDAGLADQAPPKKRSKRAALQGDEANDFMGEAYSPAPEAPIPLPNRKTTKIKVVQRSAESRNGTPASQATPGEGEERPKDYKSMTKSEKMSASMKSRWANGNMAGAVEKRKATLAAKKAAQAAADQKVGTIAPKPRAKATKKEPVAQEQQYQQPLHHQQGMPGLGYPFTTN